MRCPNDKLDQLQCVLAKMAVNGIRIHARTQPVMYMNWDRGNPYTQDGFRSLSHRSTLLIQACLLAYKSYSVNPFSPLFALFFNDNFKLKAMRSENIDFL